MSDLRCICVKSLEEGHTQETHVRKEEKRGNLRLTDELSKRLSQIGMQMEERGVWSREIGECSILPSTYLCSSHHLHCFPMPKRGEAADGIAAKKRAKSRVRHSKEGKGARSDQEVYGEQFPSLRARRAVSKKKKEVAEGLGGGRANEDAVRWEIVEIRCERCSKRDSLCSMPHPYLLGPGPALVDKRCKPCQAARVKCRVNGSEKSGGGEDGDLEEEVVEIPQKMETGLSLQTGSPYPSASLSTTAHIMNATLTGARTPGAVSLRTPNRLMAVETIITPIQLPSSSLSLASTLPSPIPLAEMSTSTPTNPDQPVPATEVRARRRFLNELELLDALENQLVTENDLLCVQNNGLGEVVQYLCDSWRNMATHRVEVRRPTQHDGGLPGTNRLFHRVPVSFPLDCSNVSYAPGSIVCTPIDIIYDCSFALDQIRHDSLTDPNQFESGFSVYYPLWEAMMERMEADFVRSVAKIAVLQLAQGFSHCYDHALFPPSTKSFVVLAIAITFDLYCTFDLAGGFVLALHKAMGVFVKLLDGYRFYSKDASVILSRRCGHHLVIDLDGQNGLNEIQTLEIDEMAQQSISRTIIFYANQTLRAIVICYCDLPSWPPAGSHLNSSCQDLARDLTLIGITGIEDTLGVRESVGYLAMSLSKPIRITRFVTDVTLRSLYPQSAK
ncbi:hypothetical protein FA15DRAFT_731578 [Coprinopsis marcescibilis]|uniref:Uncharacterized protein n=1 Tax=Coprinopsis marcescibilis TaxID=230819 RepID=A0A5C3KDN5_COPMA|nr:hypothetical protein FA15DRAFT_731578 [Coprinopsis marcescibilis]